MDYPFTSKIDELLDKKQQTKAWLSDQLGISSRTLYNKKNFAELSLDEILLMTKALQFDFLKDYNDWLRDNAGDSISMVREPETAYQKKEKYISVELKIRGTYEAIGLHFVDLLKIIRTEGEKLGLEIE